MKVVNLLTTKWRAVQVLLLLLALSAADFEGKRQPHTDSADSVCSTKHENSELHNSAWVQSAPFRGFRTKDKTTFTESDTLDLAQRLKDHNIRYAYIFAGPFGVDGKLPEFAFSETAHRAVQIVKTKHPGLQVLPWIGGVQDGTVFLEKEEWRASAISETKRLIETLGVPGVHFDFEYVLPDIKYVVEKKNLPDKRLEIDSFGGHLITFFQETRAALPSAFISTVVPSTSPDVRSWKRALTVEQVSKISEYADQISIIFYDTGIVTQERYERALHTQLTHLRTWKQTPSGKHTQYLVGFGTFENEPELRSFRSLEIESIPNHFSTLHRLLQKFGSSVRFVDGAAMYCEWEATKTDWQLFNEHWASRVAE